MIGELNKQLKFITMRKLISFMHISLDGFVGGPNGEMDWINVDADIFDYAGQMTNNSDMALYGRKTFEMMEGYWPTAGDQPGASKHDIEHSTWYNKVPKIVISNTLAGKSLKNVTVLNKDFAEKINAFKKEEGQNIVIFGSPGATHALMQDNLVDGYWLFVNPVILGKGIQFFANFKDRVNLKLVESHAFNSGVVGLHYEVIQN
jgi:dihydrofolate reductase